MKKLLVVFLAAVMVLSLGAIAMAADVSTWMGGDLFYKYNSAAKAWVADDSVFTVGNITAKVSKDNTWAKTFLNIDTWTGTPINGALHYAVGMDKIGGIASISFSTKDQDLCNIGQYSLMDLFDDFKTDPVFNTYDCGNSAALVIDTDSFTFKSEAVIIGTANPNVFAAEGIFKFDGGKAYVAYKGNAGATHDGTLIDGGLEMKLGDMTLKADAWLTGVAGTSTGTTVQGNVASGPWDATLSVFLPPGGGTNVIGVGGNYKLTDAFTVGAIYENTTNATYEVKGTYHIGVIDLRVGYVCPGTGSSDDNYFVLGVHAGIW